MVITGTIVIGIASAVIAAIAHFHLSGIKTSLTSLLQQGEDAAEAAATLASDIAKAIADAQVIVAGPVTPVIPVVSVQQTKV